MIGGRVAGAERKRQRTNGDGLDPDALLDMRISIVVGVLALQDLLSAEGVDEGCAAWFQEK